MALLTRDQILKADDLERREVAVPEWGGSVLVVGLTGTQRDAFEASVAARNGTDTTLNLQNIRSRLVSMTVIDDKGERLFGPADVNELGKKSARALDRVFSAAMGLSGLRDEDVKEMAENFTDGQSDDSTSA